MLAVPLIQTASANTSPATRSSPGEKTTEDNAFGQLLDSVTDGPLPEDIRAEMLEQVQEGVPLPEVLANLLERLRDEPDLALTPGMLPVLQAMTPANVMPEEGLALRLAAGRGAENAASSSAATDAEGEPDLQAEAEAGDIPQTEPLLGKQKALFAGRVPAVESAGTLTPVANSTQSAALRALDMPGGFSTLQATSPDAATSTAGRSEQMSLSTRLGDPQWGQALAQRIVWMVGQDKQTAEIRLNPANLGPLEVKLTLHHDQASVSMLASTGAVRDALEQALPRLRDMLSQQDINLVQVDVGQRQAPQSGDAQADHGHQSKASGSAGNTLDGALDDAQNESGSMLTLQSRGLLDAYA